MPWLRRWTSRNLQVQRLHRLVRGQSPELVLSDLLRQDIARRPLTEQMAWLGSLIAWLIQEGRESADVRGRFLLQLLERNPDWRAHLLDAVDATLRNGRFLSLFGEVDFATEHGLWGDVLARFMKRVLPAVESVEFREILLDAIGDEEGLAAFSAVSDDTWARLGALVCREGNAALWEGLRRETGEALLYLSAHVAHYGLSGEIQRRALNPDHVSKSPFLRLGLEVRSGDSLRIADAHKACRDEIARLYAELEGSGVSVAAVNRLETISSLLAQLQRVLALNAMGRSTQSAADAMDFLKHAASLGLRSREVLGYVRRHFYLLSKKIVERNGRSGEHYIARDRGELISLLWSSIGGGVIVVGMTYLKIALMHASLPPLFLATGFWAVYSGGFLLMQFTGTSLATKMPSFTASRLASLLVKMRRQDASRFRDELRRVGRSQALALLGNVVGVVTFGLASSSLMSKVGGGVWSLSEPYARHVLESLHPLSTFALPLAALTGIELWLSSLAGGWFENWLVFSRLPEGLERHLRLRRLFGPKFTIRLSEWVSEHASAFAANLALGFLFGFVPVLGVLLGIDLNGHHVTIATASAVASLTAVRFELPGMEMAWVIAGLAGIGLMNFLLSFGIALYVAASARRMKVWRVMLYLRGRPPRRGAGRG